MQYKGITLLRLKEAMRDNPNTFCDYRRCKLVIRQDMEVDWSLLDMASTSILEILVPNDAVDLTQIVDGKTTASIVQHDPQVCVRIYCHVPGSWSLQRKPPKPKPADSTPGKL